MKSRLYLLPLLALGLVASEVSAVAAPPEKLTYIVKVKAGKSVDARAAITKAGGEVTRTFSNIFEGFTLTLPESAAKGLSNNPNIELMEEDAAVDASAIQSPTPSWGLDRVDQRTKVSGTGSFGYMSAGSGATVYIADTGIYPHNDFAARLSSVGYTAYSDGNGTVDCNGHGTHVAGTVAGTTYGIAKNARLVPVRILDCSGRGSYSTVIAGLDWILSSANSNSKTQAVVNMSLGGSVSTTLNAAIARLTSAGIVVVVAAGNNNLDACNYSPSSAPSAITVGSTTSSDSKSSFSNWGSCVDINAPGSSITSSWIGSATATNTISGTSMASPHVAGIAAVYLGLNPTASVATVTSALNASATLGAISGLTSGTINALAYVSPDDAPIAVDPTPTPSPSPSPTPTKTRPTAKSKAASNITVSAASLGGTVNAGNDSTSVFFEYGTDATFTSNTKKVSSSPATVSGTSDVDVALSIASLTASTKYYVRVVATNSLGTTTSDAISFTTQSAPVVSPSPTPTPTPTPAPTPAPTPGTGKSPQTITFPAIPNPEFGPAPRLLATASSGLPITYTSMTPKICTVYNVTPAFVQYVGGLGKTTGSWSCTVRASQPGSDKYEAATPVDQSFTWIPSQMKIVVSTTPSLTFSKSMPVVSALRFTTENLNSGLTGIGHLVTTKSLTPTTCRVDSFATWDQPGGILNRAFVTGLAVGTCTLQFDFAGQLDRLPATLVWSATVKK